MNSNFSWITEILIISIVWGNNWSFASWAFGSTTKYYMMHFVRHLMMADNSTGLVFLWFTYFLNIFLAEDKYIYSINESSLPQEEVTCTQHHGRWREVQIRQPRLAKCKKHSYPVLFTHFVIVFSWLCRFSGLLHGSSKNNAESITPSAPPLGMPPQEVHLPAVFV